MLPHFVVYNALKEPRFFPRGFGFNKVCVFFAVFVITNYDPVGYASVSGGCEFVAQASVFQRHVLQIPFYVAFWFSHGLVSFLEKMGAEPLVGNRPRFRSGFLSVSLADFLCFFETVPSFLNQSKTHHLEFLFIIGIQRCDREWTVGYKLVNGV